MPTFYNLLNELAELAPDFCSRTHQIDKEGHPYNVWRCQSSQPGSSPEHILQYDSENSRASLSEPDLKNLAYAIKTQLLHEGWSFACWYRARPIHGNRCWEIELSPYGKPGTKANFHEATGDSEAECFLKAYASQLRDPG